MRIKRPASSTGEISGCGAGLHVSLCPAILDFGVRRWRRRPSSECQAIMFNVGDGLRPRTHCTWLQFSGGEPGGPVRLNARNTRLRRPAVPVASWRRWGRCGRSSVEFGVALAGNSSCYGNDLGWLLLNLLYFCIRVVSYDEFCVTAHGVTGVSHRACIRHT